MRLFLLLPLLLWSCGETPAANPPVSVPENHAAVPETAPSQMAVPDSAAPSVAADWLIIPGKKIGHTILGEDPQGLIRRLGPPDASDAAMGKAWLIWDGKNKENTLAVFTTYADSNMNRKAIRQIRVTASRFQTSDGIRTGMKIPEIQRVFPRLKAAETALSPEAAFRYDAVSEGISFEFSGKSENDSCTAILIYPPGDNPTAYLPIPH